jgi:hypothetical protein
MFNNSNGITANSNSNGHSSNTNSYWPDDPAIVSLTDGLQAISNMGTTNNVNDFRNTLNGYTNFLASLNNSNNNKNLLKLQQQQQQQLQYQQNTNAYNHLFNNEHDHYMDQFNSSLKTAATSNLFNFDKLQALQNNKEFTDLPGDNNLYHTMVSIAGKSVRLIQWCDETDINMEELRKRQRSSSTETEFSSDDDIKMCKSNSGESESEIDSLIKYIKTLSMDLSMTNKKEYLKLESILKLIDYKLNKLDNIEKLETMIKRVEKKFDYIIREKDYEISNLKEELDTLKLQLNENTSEIKSMNDYFI